MFKTPFYEKGVAKFERDKHYPVTAETRSRVLSGDDHAEYIEIEMDKGTAAQELAAAQVRLDNELRATIAAEREAAEQEAAAKRGTAA
jgi:outer membrane murein-binding lipoprotein Lpp